MESMYSISRVGADAVMMPGGARHRRTLHQHVRRTWSVTTARFAVFTLFCLLTSFGSVAAQDPNRAPTPEEKATDTKQMLQIWKALKVYIAEKGTTPDFLSDLVPQYLPDKQVLVSPIDRRKGYADKISGEDPKLPCSYRYTFGMRNYGTAGETSRTVKERQMQEFGPVVPILRCFQYPRALNIAYSGDVFETDQDWEGAPETAALIEKLGLGEGFKVGEFTTLTILDKSNGDPVEGAEVRLTKREYYSLPLPDRTVKTDAKGEARIPLGPRHPRTRRLSVAVSKPGLIAKPETWTESSMFLQRSISLTPSVFIGGVIKRDDNTLLSNATVTIYLVEPRDADSTNERLFATATADAQGVWRCELPKDFTRLALHVSHSSTQVGKYSCTEDGREGTISRESLLELSAEFRIAAVSVISGTITDSQGAPVSGAEIFIHPRTLRKTALTEDSNNAEAMVKLPITTDEKGAFSLPWKHTEDVVLTVFSNDHAPAQQTVVVSAAIQPMKLTLAKGRQISARVLDSNEKPVPGATVHLFTLGSNGVPIRKVIATTDTDGQFTWGRAPRSAVALIVMKEGYSGVIKDFGFAAIQQAVIKMSRTDTGAARK